MPGVAPSARGERMFIKGMDMDYRRGVDYGFPVKELEYIKSEHQGVDVLYNVGANTMEVWAMGNDGHNYYLFEVDKNDTYKIKDMLDASQTNRNNRRRSSTGEYDFAREVFDRNEKKKLDEEARFRNHLDPDRIAHKAANALGMRGIKGAPATQISMGAE